MRKSYYVMHKLLRYAKNVLCYAVIITLCGNYYVMWRHTRSPNYLLTCSYLLKVLSSLAGHQRASIFLQSPLEAANCGSFSHACG